jgi:hypothetical protein
VIVRQPLLEPTMLYAPFADQEIEIVQAADVGLLDPLWIVLRGADWNDDANGCRERAGRGKHDAEAIHLTLPW